MPSLRLFLATVLVFAVNSSLAADRPNFVWIVSEDNSIHYHAHFFPGGAQTPNIEALAAHGLTYNHAFSNAPVCSVARSTLATMCLGPRIGTQFHRKYVSANLPKGQPTFYQSMREAGYFATNHKKTDFNFVSGAQQFDKGNDWRARKDKDQPFFHMESHGNSHESSLHFKDTEKETDFDPEAVQLADYHPSTPLFKYTHARYLDNIMTIDGIVGKTMAKLEEDGLLEDTFVFYFGDHGGVLPRGKGYAYESGLHVPLVVRVPENFKHLVDGLEMGERRSGFVSFIDFGPTVLNLAGAAQPSGIDGVPFLGAGAEKAAVEAVDTYFGHADRMDEKYDFVRTIRKGKYQYLRIFQPHYADGLQNNYRYRMLAFEEWRELFKAGKLNAQQAQFFEGRPAELLYDCEADPHQVRNLAGDPAFEETLVELRGILGKTLRSLPDLSLFPESVLGTKAMEDPVGFGQRNQELISRCLDVADLSLLSFGEAKDKLVAAAKSEERMERYWAAMAALAFREVEGAKEIAPAFERLLEDDFLPVRVRAAEFLGGIGHLDPQPALAEVVNTTQNAIEATEALQAVVHFNDKAEGKGRYAVDLAQLKPASNSDGVSRRMGYLHGNPDGWKAAKKGNAKGKK